MTTREEKEMWEGLLGHPAWTLVETFIAEQTAARTVKLINGCETRREEDILRGELLGLGLFLQYPKTMVEVLSVELDNEIKE